MSQTINAGIERRGTGRGGYALALVLWLAVFAAMVGLIVTRVNGMADHLIQVVVPADVALTLDQPGTYTIFHEANVVVDGRLYAASSIAGLSVSVSSHSGAPIAVRVPGTTSNYSIKGRQGRSAFEFDIAEPGTYRLVAAYPGGRAEPQTVLAIGQGFVGALVTTILTALGVALAGTVLAVAIAVRTFTKRRSHRLSFASARTQPAGRPVMSVAITASSPIVRAAGPAAATIATHQGGHAMDTARLGIRIVAGIIDLVIVGAVFYVIAAMSGQTTEDGFNLTGLPAIVSFLIGIGYYVVMEATTGATLGKMALGLRVVRVDGGAISWGESAIRNVLRIIDGLFIYLVAVILIATSAKRQRLGDRAADTIVVRRT